MAWRSTVAAALAAVVGMMLPGTPAHAAPLGRGTASARGGLVTVSVAGAPGVDDVTVSLGRAATDATTSGLPEALAALTALQVDAQPVAGLEVSSTSGTSADDGSWNLSGPGVDATLLASALTASAGADDAAASIESALARLDASVVHLDATVGAEPFESTVSRTESAGRAGVRIGSFDLGAGDLVQAAVLDALPISVLGTLADLLGVDDGALDAAAAALATVTDALQAVAELAGALSDAEDELDELLATETAIAAAEGAVSSAETAVSSASAAITAAAAATEAAEDEIAALESDVAALEAQRDALQALLDACVIGCGVVASQLVDVQAQLGAATSALAAAQADLAAATADLAAAQADLAAAHANLAAATAQLAALPDPDAVAAQVAAAVAEIGLLDADLAAAMTDLSNSLAALPDVQAAADSVRDAIGAAPLLSFDALSFGASAVADGVAGAADTECTVLGLEVLGSPVADISCPALIAAYDEIEAAVSDLLDALPAGAPAFLPDVFGLAQSSATTGPDPDRVTTAAAEVTALEVAIPSVSMHQVTDGLVGAATDAAAAVTALGLLPPGDAAALGGLVAQLDSLPSGMPAGLRTTGLRVAVGGVVSSARFIADPPVVVVPSATPTTTATPAATTTPTSSPAPSPTSSPAPSPTPAPTASSPATPAPTGTASPPVVATPTPSTPAVEPTARPAVTPLPTPSPTVPDEVAGERDERDADPKEPREKRARTVPQDHPGGPSLRPPRPVPAGAPLPFTGAGLLPLIAVALWMLVAGLHLMAAGRMRRDPECG